MPDLATIGAALGSIKTATEIAKFLRESDISLEKAELKLKLAELLVSLSDAKVELVAVQDELAQKDKQIAELNSAFEAKDDLVRRGDGYYAMDERGEATGKPFCLRCWESNHKQRQLVGSPKDHRTRVCTSCGHQYDNLRVAEIRPKPEGA
jgi:rRNA maturation endonuclease Nob1